MSKFPRKLRSARAEDVPFVMDSWQRSYSRSPWAGVVPNNRWLVVMRDLVTGLLARGARLTVACNPEDEDQILGWACWEKDDDKTVVHYVYVKDPFRRDCIGDELLAFALGPAPRFFHTHLTDAGQAALRRCPFGHAFAPEIARRKEL